MEGTAKEARRRTAAQTKAKNEDGVGEEVQVQDEQEQEDEIETFRKQNDANNLHARNTMDIGVGVTLLITLITLSKFSGSTRIIPLVVLYLQTFLLPLSLTPHRLGPLAATAKTYHGLVTFIHFFLLVIALHLLFYTSNWGAYDIARWSLPLVVSCAVQYERLGEREMEERIAGWEKKKYTAKGA